MEAWDHQAPGDWLAPAGSFLVVTPVFAALSSRFLIFAFRSLVFVQASWDRERPLLTVLFRAGVLLPAVGLVLDVGTPPVERPSCAQYPVFAQFSSAVPFHPNRIESVKATLRFCCDTYLLLFPLCCKECLRLTNIRTY